MGGPKPTSKRALLFFTPSYEALATQLASRGGHPLGEIERRRFADGERYKRIVTPCEGRDVILLGGTVTDEDTLDIYDLAASFVALGASTLTLVIPFFGYSTMERADRPGEVVTAKTRARLLSSLPVAALGNRVLLVDLHVSGMAHYFESEMHPKHVSARELVSRLAKELGGRSYALGCTDAGRAKWVEGLALDLGVDTAFVYKRRVDGGRSEVSGVSAHVSGKKVVIYDDMIRSGTSLINAARAYKEAGATEIAVVATHGVLPEGAPERLTESGLFSAVVVTDTHPRALACEGGLVRVESIAPVLVKALASG